MRKPNAKAVMSPSSCPIKFAFEDMMAASLATAIKAGSAMVVEKPSKNENNNNQKTLPFLANELAITSPKGNNPISSPLTNNMSPTTTKTPPNNTFSRLGNGCLNTTN